MSNRTIALKNLLWLMWITYIDLRNYQIDNDEIDIENQLTIACLYW